VLLPTRELAMTGSYDMGPVTEFARHAEALGFDSVWAGESLLARPRLDPLVVLSSVAAVTSTIELGTAALTVALRNPMVAANSVASLTHAANGRLTLGLGSGFPLPETELECAVAGVPYRQRAGYLDETVRLWRQAWGAGPNREVFTGRYREFTGVDRLLPASKPGGPALWLAGGSAPAVLRRTAALYDGWLPYLPSADDYAAALARIGEEATAAGRAPESITPGLYATVLVDPDHRRAEQQLDGYARAYYGRSLSEVMTVQAFGYGSVRECADRLSAYVRAGARHLVLRVGSTRPLDHLTDLAEKLVPALRANLD
jgi:alkanesulfonate monooxygenase SsuD/methylene tetrahydromethanopterin reductase-like flavin-dependent oxidoreductase (luciferase family)